LPDCSIRLESWSVKVAIV